MRRLLRILLILTGLPVLLMAALLLVANTGPGRDFIARQIGPLSGGLVQIEGLAGQLPLSPRLARLKISDDAGVWLLVEEIALDLNPWPLWRGQIQVEALDRNRLLADITRVLPISGTFGPEQREIYELVLAAQRAALDAVKPGNDFMEPNRCAMQVLAHGLEALGILPCSAEEALRDEHQFYRRYSLHNISHMLGLDVHDCAKARAEVYKYGPLVAGMVLTIEPGLYFQPDDLTVPARYRGIGVRIEDDVLVVPTGHVNLSAHIPKTVAEVEAWMADVWASAPRA